jgi:hypothetical protein
LAVAADSFGAIELTICWKLGSLRSESHSGASRSSP